MSTSKEKVAVVSRGGGMRSGHSAAVLYEMQVELGLPPADIVVGASGSAGASVYSLTGDREHMEKVRRIWTKHLARKDFIRPLKVPLLDVDVLVDKVLKEQEPLNEQLLAESSGDYAILVVNPKTGEVRFVDKSQNEDIYEVFRATKAHPLLYGRKVALSTGEYIDCTIAVSNKRLINEAVARGATRILFINNGTPASMGKKLIEHMYAYAQSKGLRTTILTKEAVPSLVEDEHVVRIEPGKLPTSQADNDESRLQMTWERGCADAWDKREQIKNLFRFR